jgi:hypothetical protein
MQAFSRRLDAKLLSLPCCPQTRHAGRWAWRITDLTAAPALRVIVLALLATRLVGLCLCVAAASITAWALWNSGSGSSRRGDRWKLLCI